jgi:protein SCO1/2
MAADGSPPPPSAPTRHRRKSLTTAIAVVVIAVVGVLAIRQYFALPPKPAAVGQSTGQTTAAAIGGPFTLIDQDGRTVTNESYRGRYMLIYFGFTYCPDICPLSLQRNADALALLGSKAEAIVPILITVDPERDSPALLKDYVAAFDPRMVGLTGSAEQIRAAADAYRVYYAKAVPAGSAPENYLMDHSGFTYLMAPDGRFVQFFRHDTSADAMAERLRKVLAGRV